MIHPQEALTMTFDTDRVSLAKRFLRLEFDATVVLVIRAIPSIMCWIGLIYLWLSN